MKKIILLLLLMPSLAFGQATGYILSNFPTPGSIGSAATTVDVYSRIYINQTTPSITLTVPNPTNTSTKVTEVWIGNKGTTPFTLVPGGFIDTASSVILKWTGAAYSVIGRSSVSAIPSASLASTGVLTYAGSTIASTTQINIGAITGQIIDNETNPTLPTKTVITYAGASNVTVPTIGSGLATYVLINSSNTIVFQNTFPTSAQRKSMIYLTKIGHPTGTINTIGNEPDFVLSPLGQLRDLTKYIGFINEGVRTSANGANLNFNISSGTVYRSGGGFVANNTTPDESIISAATPATFLYRTQTGVGGAPVSLIDPTVYDNAGTSTTITGSTNQATNQRIYLIPGLGLIVQQGQTIYTTLNDAIAAVQSEAFVVYPSLVNNSVLIGVLSVQKGATALNNTAQARFFTPDKFGEVSGATAGVSTATLQGAYSNSLQPQITTSATGGSVQIKRGSAADTDAILQGLNGAGSTTFSVNGNGVVSAGAWQGTAIADSYIASSGNWNNAYTNRIATFTTTGSSGAATFSGNTLNIPNYTFSGLAGTQSANTIYSGPVSGGPSAPTFRTLTLSDLPAINPEVGIVYNEGFASGTVATNYNKTGATATFVQSTGKITVDNGVGNWIESISTKNYKLANSKLNISARYTVKTLNTMGIGFGIKTNPYDIRFHLDQSTSSASFIRLYLNGTEISNQIRTTAQTMSVSVNDVIDVNWRQVGTDTYITYTNLTTFAKLQYVYRHINNAVVSPIAYSIGFPTVYSLAGQSELTKFTITDNNQFNPDYIFIWDSIGRGADALGDDYSWFGLLLKSGVNAVMLSAPGGSLDDFNVTEFLNTLNLYSKRAIVINGLGTNGVESDGGSTTYTKYVAFNTAISALGFTVQSATLMGSTSNVNTFNASVRANITNYYDLGAIDPDRIGLHPTLSGSRQIAREFLTKITTSKNIASSDLLDCTVYRNRIINSHTGLLLGFNPSTTFTTSSTSFTATSIPAGLPTSGILKITKTSTGEYEFVEYNAKSSTQILGVKRAQMGSTAISISSAADAYISFVHTITNGVDNSTPSFHTSGLAGGILGHYYNSTGLTPFDAYAFKMSDANLFRIHSTGSAQLSVLRNSGSSFGKISIDVLVSGSPREGYGMFVNTSNQFGLLRATTSTLDDAVPILSSNTSGNISFGLHSKTYRLTNGGSDVTSDFLVHPTKNTVATVKKYALDNTNGFVLIDVNSGATPIANASLITNVTTNTAGSETANLNIQTNSGGTGLATRATIGVSGLTFPTAGQGITIKTGSNARAGTATLVSGTVTISNTSITANTLIFLTPTETGTLTGTLRPTARVNGTSFTVGSGTPTDNVTFSYLLIEGN